MCLWTFFFFFWICRFEQSYEAATLWFVLKNIHLSKEGLDECSFTGHMLMLNLIQFPILGACLPFINPALSRSACLEYSLPEFCHLLDNTYGNFMNSCVFFVLIHGFHNDSRVLIAMIPSILPPPHQSGGGTMTEVRERNCHFLLGLLILRQFLWLWSLC